MIKSQFVESLINMESLSVGKWWLLFWNNAINVKLHTKGLFMTLSDFKPQLQTNLHDVDKYIIRELGLQWL